MASLVPTLSLHRWFAIATLMICMADVGEAGAAEFNDSFVTGLSSTYWTVASNQPLYTWNATNGDLRLGKPAGGTLGAFQTINVDYRFRLRGDFDVSVAFRNAQIDRVSGSPANQVQLNAIFGSQLFSVVRDDDIIGGDNRHVYIDPPRDWRGAQATTATAGTLRITRVGSTVTGYFNGTAIFSGIFNTNDVSRIWLSLQNNGTTDATSVTFDDFHVTADDIFGSTECTCAGDLADTFDDGTLLPLWASISSPPGSGTPIESGGELIMAKPSGFGTVQAGPVVRLNSGIEVCGDFDISVDFSLPNFPTPPASLIPPGARAAGLQVRTVSDGSFVATVERYARQLGDCNPSTQNYKAWSGTPLNCTSSWAATNDFTGRLRITRQGSNYAMFYWQNGTWVQLRSNGGTDQPVWISLFSRTDLVPGNQEGRFDNLSIESQAESTPPVISVPADVTATTGPGTESCADVRVTLDIGTATATDNCSQPAIAVAGLPAGNLFPVGETILTWSATDDAGNIATSTQRVIVSCPAGDIAGSASLVCNGQTQPADDVTVRLLHEGTPFRSTLTDPTGGYRFDEVRHGTYTVSIEAPAGFATAPDTRVVTLDQNEVPVAAFDFTCLLSDLAGQVTGTCNGETGGVQGVTVDVFRDDGQGTDVLVATAATDANGDYRFDDLALGDYTIGLVMPLGYAASVATQDVTLDVADGSLAAPAFTLACQIIAAEPRSMGYWKHQINVYLTGKGHAQESLADLLHDIDELVIHFNENLVNPVIVYVPNSANTQDKLLQLQQLLTVNRGGTTLDRAKQHLLALLLNVVSGKISQTEVICDNGATVSQAITHSHDLIVDGNTGNDDVAKTICELINGGGHVAAALLPAGVREITYKTPGADGALAVLGVNRSTGDTTVSLHLPADGTALLSMYNVAGRRLWHQPLALSRGSHAVSIPEAARFATGVYLLVLRQAGATATKRVVMMR